VEGGSWGGDLFEAGSEVQDALLCLHVNGAGLVREAEDPSGTVREDSHIHLKARHKTSLKKLQTETISSALSTAIWRGRRGGGQKGKHDIRV
jgi:hypothetical protein